MAIKDLLHFDSDAYRAKIQSFNYTNQELANNIYRKRREIASSGWSIGAGIALIPITAGVSAVTSTYATRTLSIARQKLWHLECEWSRRGYPPLSKRTLKDFVVPCTITGAVGAIGIGLDATFASPLAAVGSSAAPHAHAFLPPHSLPDYHTVQHFGSGVANGVHQGFDAIVGSPGPQVAAAPYHPDPYFAAGQFAGLEAEKFGVNYGVGQAGVYLEDQFAQRR